MLAEWVLEINFTSLYIGKPDEELGHRIWFEILNVEPHSEMDYGVINRIIKKHNVCGLTVGCMSQVWFLSVF